MVVDPSSGEKVVRYMPFFDEEDENGASVQLDLFDAPKIEPAWSYTLQYYALAYAISNFSSINPVARRAASGGASTKAASTSSSGTGAPRT